MKKVLIALLVFSFWPLLAYSSTLVCDPQAGIAYYLVEGLPLIVATDYHVPAKPDGSIALVVDALPTVAIKIYTVRAKACILGECSEWSAPFDFPWPLPAIPKGIRIQK